MEERPIPIHPSETQRPPDYEIRSDRGSRAAGTAAGVVVVLAAVMAALAVGSCLSGCGSALADQCEALYAGADTPEKLLAADAACMPDGGVP
jgi:hypothetical protein